MNDTRSCAQLPRSWPGATYMFTPSIQKVLPSSVPQVQVENTQHYVTERSGWLSKKLMPEKVDIEVGASIVVAIIMLPAIQTSAQPRQNPGGAGCFLMRKMFVQATTKLEVQKDSGKILSHIEVWHNKSVSRAHVSL